MEIANLTIAIYLIIGILLVVKSVWLSLYINNDNTQKLRSIASNQPFSALLGLIISIILWPMIILK